MIIFMVSMFKKSSKELLKVQIINNNKNIYKRFYKKIIKCLNILPIIDFSSKIYLSDNSNRIVKYLIIIIFTLLVF